MESMRVSPKSEAIMYSRNKVIAIAKAEVGYLEKSRSAYQKNNKIIYQKTAGAGYDNYTKYGYEMHQIYPSVMNFPAAWCDAFVDWCFYTAYGVTTAKSLLGGNFDDYTVESSKMYRKHNALDKIPEVGSQIFFTNNGDVSGCYHTGLVIEVSSDKKTVTTIEGNTSASGSNIEANGGCVAKKTRSVTKNTLFGHPNYGDNQTTGDTTSSTTTNTTQPTVLWYGKVTASELNVRRYPHTSAKIDYTVKRDDPVAVEENSHWYKIGTNRWICADYVKKTTVQSQEVKGIDVSSYQGDIDWKKVAADGVKFVILRGVVKDGTMDKKFQTNYDGALAAGIEVKGVYHFLYATSIAEAVVAANTMVQRLNGLKIFVWLDLEWSNLGATGQVTEIANAYIDAMKAQGYECGVYSNKNWYKNYYKASQLHTDKFWIASYASSGAYKIELKPNVGEEIWQWGSKGKVNGINGNVDMNIYYQEGGEAYVVTASTLNIRTLPCSSDPSAKIVGTLKKGATVNVLEDSLWYKIQNTKAVGWSSAKYITK